MKKNIVILGSTGSIGKITLNIIRKDKKNFKIKLLSTNTNLSLVIKQAKEFNVKNIIITNLSKYNYAIKNYYKLKINFYYSFDILDKLFSEKNIFYSMVSIVGIDGLAPSLKLIRYSKNIAIVNKESIICGWSLIKKKLKNHKTRFIPVDSEHFSIFSLMNTLNYSNIDQIFITASGGPFFKFSKKQIQHVKIKEALKHPNWKMGKKISIDSATMMNKVFEVIEAKNIFSISYKNIKILTHPKSYIHSIVKEHNGLIKILIHEPNMMIPIHNSIYLDNQKKMITKNINLDYLNNLELCEIDINKFPLVNILKLMPNYNSLYETVLLTINDFFVSKFLDKKITYVELINFINKFSFNRHFLTFRRKYVRNLKEIYQTRDYVYFKLNSLGI